MSEIAGKLIVIFAVVALGWIAGRTRSFGGAQPVRVVSHLAFFVLTPALLFRAMAHVDVTTLPWIVIGLYYGPLVALLLAAYGFLRVRHHDQPAVPGVGALSVTFGNMVQVGLPVVTALFGATGLTVHVALISVHALILMTICTVLVELDVARARTRSGGDRPSVAAMAAVTARRTVVHPVVLPIAAGLAYNLTGLAVPRPVDDVLALLAQAVVPVCLILIGLSLAYHGVSRGGARTALAASALKLVALPAVVLLTAYFLGDLRGVTLSVIVVCAGLPIGANALLFAQRYEVREAETAAGVVLSTLTFAVTGTGWLLLANHLGG